MKTKALILSALILVPTAGAAAVQQPVSAPAQDFRVSYTKAALLTSSSVFSKTNLPQVLSDEELEGVTGEGGASAVAGAAITGLGAFVGGVVYNGYNAVANYLATGSTQTTFRDAALNVGALTASGLATGATIGFFFPAP